MPHTPRSLPYLFSIFSNLSLSACQIRQITGVVKVILVFYSTVRKSPLYSSALSFVGYFYYVIDEDDENQWREHTSLSHPCLDLEEIRKAFTQIIHRTTWWVKRSCAVNCNDSLRPREYLYGYDRKHTWVNEVNKQGCFPLYTLFNNVSKSKNWSEQHIIIFRLLLLTIIKYQYFKLYQILRILINSCREYSI